MSDAIYPLTPVVQYDPRVNLTPSTQYAVKKGGANETLNNFPSSSYSNSQVNFLPIVPNMDTIVSRNAMYTFYYEVTIIGTTDQATMSDCLGLLIAPRQNPNANVVNTISSTINNTSVSINLANVISSLQKYNIDAKDYIHDLSTFPSMPDFFQNYNDGFATALDPLQQIGNSGYQQPRGGFPIEIVSSTPTSLTFRFASTEPLYLSPWLIEESHGPGLFGVNNLTFNMVLGDLNRSVSINTDSIAPNITISSIATTLYRAPEMLFTFIQPSNIAELPQSIPYSYQTIEDYQTDFGSAVSGGATFSITSQNIQLSSIPKRIYVYARRSNFDQDYSTSDVFARLNSISVNFDVQSGLLASANSLQLYKMSAYNGYQGSWSQWNSYTGSVLAIDFSRDIMLQNPAEAVGLGNVKKNIQITCNFTNLNSNPVSYTLFVVVVSDGLFTLTRGQSVTQTGVLTQSDVLNALDMPGRDDAPKPSNFYGGSILSKGLKFLKKGADVVEKYAPRALKTAERVSRGDYVGAVKSAVTGKGLVGGKIMSKNDLMKRRNLLYGSGSNETGNEQKRKLIRYKEDDYEDEYDVVYQD